MRALAARVAQRGQRPGPVRTGVRAPRLGAARGVAGAGRVAQRIRRASRSARAASRRTALRLQVRHAVLAGAPVGAEGRRALERGAGRRPPGWTRSGARSRSTSRARRGRGAGGRRAGRCAAGRRPRAAAPRAPAPRRPRRAQGAEEVGERRPQVELPGVHAAGEGQLRAAPGEMRPALAGQRARRARCRCAWAGGSIGHHVRVGRREGRDRPPAPPSVATANPPTRSRSAAARWPACAQTASTGSPRPRGRRAGRRCRRAASRTTRALRGSAAAAGERRSPMTAARRRGDRRRAGGRERPERAPREVPGALARAERAPAPAAPGAATAPGALELRDHRGRNGGSPTSSIGAGARRPGVAEDEPRLDRAVVPVHLEADRRVHGRAGRRGQRRAAAERHAARPRAARGEREGDVPPLPHRARLGEQRGRDEQRRLGIAHAEGRQALELLGQPEVQRVAGHDGVDPLHGHQVRRPQHRRGVLREGLAERLDALRARWSGRRPRDARRGAGGRRRRRRARRAGRRPGWSAPSRFPRRRRARSGPPGGGGARRSARRRCRSRPDASPRPPARRRARSPVAATCASASKRMRVSTSRRSALTASSSAAIGRGARDVGGEQELEAGVGAVQAPRGVDPGARRNPIAPASTPLGSTRDTSISAWSPGLRVDASARSPARTSRRFSPTSGTTSATVASATTSRSASAAAGPSRRLQQRPRELVRDAGRAQLGARVAAERGMDDRRVRQPAVGARRVVVRDHDVHARPRGPPRPRPPR